MGVIELAISLHAEKCRVVSNLENIAKLRADAENARAEAAENGRLAEIVGDLLVGVADEADKDLSRQELRNAPVEMEVDAALVLRTGVLEIVGEAANAGKFRACRRVQIGVTGAEIDGAVTDAEIGETAWIIGADRNVARAVDHEVVDAAVPLEVQRLIEIAIGDERVFEESHARADKRSYGCGQGAGEARSVSSPDAGQGSRQLAAKHRLGEGIGRGDELQVGLTAQGDI